MCDFPAAKLLEKRREAPLKYPPITALAMVAEIDRLRWAHEEKTSCDCWDKAIEASPNPLQPKQEERAA